MTKFYMRLLVYLFCFVLAMFGLSSLDFNRFLKKGKVGQAQVLYFIIACILAYLLGSFFMDIIYYFN